MRKIIIIIALLPFFAFSQKHNKEVGLDQYARRGPLRGNNVIPRFEIKVDESYQLDFQSLSISHAFGKD